MGRPTWPISNHAAQREEFEYATSLFPYEMAKPAYSCPLLLSLLLRFLFALGAMAPSGFVREN